MATIAKVEAFRLYPRWLVVRVEASDGIVGWGEATLEGHIESVESSLQDLTERFRGQPCDNIEHIWQSAHRQRFYRSGAVLLSAMSGLDIALWDMKAKRFGVPLHQLLGGKLRDRVKVYTHVHGATPQAIREAAQRRREQGFRVVKTTPTEGLDWVDSPAKLERGVEKLKAIQAAGLDGAPLDFHGRVHKPMARKLALMVEPLAPLFIEEPLLPGQVEGIQQVAQHTATPIALGERLYSRWDFKEYFERACVDIIQPDVAHAGGISECMKIAHMAEAYDVAIAPHCPLGPVALAACVQMDIACPNFCIQEMIMPYADTNDAYHLLTYLKNPEIFQVRDGYIDIPTGNGLGIELDEDLLRKVDAKVRQSRVSWRNPMFRAEDNSIQEW